MAGSMPGPEIEVLGVVGVVVMVTVSCGAVVVCALGIVSGMGV